MTTRPHRAHGGLSDRNDAPADSRTGMPHRDLVPVYDIHIATGRTVSRKDVEREYDRVVRHARGGTLFLWRCRIRRIARAFSRFAGRWKREATALPAQTSDSDNR